MSNDMISVPRELLERILQGCMFTLGSEQYGEIKALLAQPNTCTKDGGQCGLGGYCEPCHSVEPVAWLESLERFESDGEDFVRWHDVRDVFAMIVRAPAQAPVVLPPRKIAADYWCAYEQPFPGEAAGIWNACLDEFKRLNPTL